MLKWSGVLTGSLAAPLGKLADSMHSHSVVAVDMSEVERIDFVCAGALLNVINRIESQQEDRADRRRLADHPGAPAPHRRFAAPLRQEAAIAAFPVAFGRRGHGSSGHGNLSRHHDSLRPARRGGEPRRRRPGDARQRGRQGHRAQGAPPVQRPRARGLCRRDRRCVHAVRALRGEAREAPGPARALGGRAREGLALRPHPEAARGDARRGRSQRVAHHHRHGRRARARARDRRDRLGRTLRAGGGAGAPPAHGTFRRRDRQTKLDHRGRPLHLHEPAPRDRDPGRHSAEAVQRDAEGRRSDADRLRRHHRRRGPRRAFARAGARRAGLTVGAGRSRRGDDAANASPRATAGMRGCTRSARAAPRFCARWGPGSRCPPTASRRSRRCTSRAMRAPGFTSRRTSSANARSPGSSRSGSCAAPSSARRGKPVSRSTRPARSRR